MQKIRISYIFVELSNLYQIKIAPMIGVILKKYFALNVGMFSDNIQMLHYVAKRKT